jgi:hypothetical protein
MANRSRCLGLVALVSVVPSWLAAQREVGLLYGSWEAGRTISYEARLDRPWGPALRHGIALQVTNERGAAGRAFYGVGYELEVLRGGAVLGPYAVLSGALGAESDTAGQRIAALWTAGLGLEWRPFRFFAIDAEERYRVSDRGPHGFWSPGAPRKWWSTTLGISIAVGGTSRRASAPRRNDAPPASLAAGPADPVPTLMMVGRTGDVVQRKTVSIAPV